MKNNFGNSNKLTSIIALLIFILSFIIYLLTLCPTVPPRDSGELITVAYTLGIAHPPGYPLYAILGKLFTLLPINNVAWRVNMMSAFFASCTVTIVFLILLKIANSTYLPARQGWQIAAQSPQPKVIIYITAVSASLLLAFSPIFWSQAVVAEFFTLNAFFLALLIYLVLMWRERLIRDEKASAKFLYLFAFFFGLGLGNHQTLLFALPGFAYFIWITLRNKTDHRPQTTDHRQTLYAKVSRVWQDKKFFSLESDVWCLMSFIIFFLLGLSIYLYLPIRSLSNPVIDWGNPENLKNFWAVITRADYGMLKLAKESAQIRSLDLFLRQMWAYFYPIARQFTVFGMFIALIGMWYGFKQEKEFAFSILVIFLFTGPLFVFLSNLPCDPNSLARIERFYLLSLVALAIWLGYGLYSLSTLIKRTPVILISLFLPVVSLVIHYNICSQSQNYFGYDYGMNILNTLEKEALIFSKKDNTRNILWYLQLIEGKRPDVKNVVLSLSHWWADYLLRDNPDLELGIGKGIVDEKALVEFITKSNFERYPIYIDAFTEVVNQSFYDYWVPNGILFKFYGEGKEAIDSIMVKKENNEIWSKYIYRNRYKIIEYKDFFIEEIINKYAGAHFNLGNYYYGKGQYDYAEEEYKAAIEIGLYEDEKSLNPTSYPVKRNLAGLYYIEKKYDKAIGIYKELIDIKPEDIALYNFLASAHYNKRKYDKAIEVYEKALEIEPYYPEVYNNLGLAYLNKGEIESAREMFEKALKINPKYREARRNLEMIKMR